MGPIQSRRIQYGIAAASGAARAASAPVCAKPSYVRNDRIRKYRFGSL